MFFSKKAALSQPTIIDVELSNENAGEFFRSGKHILPSILATLDDKTPIDELNIRGTRLYLSVLYAGGMGGDDICKVHLPQKLNVIRSLNIELTEDMHRWNGITGDELTILLAALPNIEKINISCRSIDNYTMIMPTGSFDFRMQGVSLPRLIECNFTTIYGRGVEQERAVVDPGIITCLLDSAPQLTREAINFKSVKLQSAPTILSAI